MEIVAHGRWREPDAVVSKLPILPICPPIPAMHRRASDNPPGQFRFASLKYLVPDTVIVAASPVFVIWYR
jgi:hypothetical protein